MKVSDLLELNWNDIQKMTAKQLKPIVQFGALQANRYLKSAERYNYTSPGLETGQKRAKEKGRYYSTKNSKGQQLNRNQLRTELKDILAFLDNKTLTRKGAHEFYKKSYERISVERPDAKGLTDEQLRKFWKVYKKFTEIKGGFYESHFGSLGSQNIQQKTFNYLVDTGSLTGGYLSEEELPLALDEYFSIMEYDDTFFELAGKNASPLGL